MFIPNITAEGIARVIVCRAIGEQAAAANDLYNAIKDYPALQHLVDILLNHVQGLKITDGEFNTAMNELLTFQTMPGIHGIRCNTFLLSYD